MGSSDSKCAGLLERMGWPDPEWASDFQHSALAEYLEAQNLEVVLPRHAPQCDISMADRKPSMYPRPGFCSEAYKMHVGLIGPSSAGRKQIRELMPKIANVFNGPAARLGPGREALPQHFLDERLHRLVLWDLPEISFRQNCEDYIREIGLLYFDCVFMLFSDKYVVTDIYSKLCVAMAIHGVPFFVLCTMSGEELDDKAWMKLKSDFQKKDIQARMFNPRKPQGFLEELMSDFFKEVSWNRNGRDDDITKGVSDDILGQTVRLKNIEKKPELNGRCGVCIGFDKQASRYRIRLILSGVETDFALRQESFSILKPKLLRALVRLKGLESRPELNGRYGFVDEYLRESERYRVFVPGRPNEALALALKAANLERTESFADAAPVRDLPPGGAAGGAPKAPEGRARAFDPPAREKPAAKPQPTAPTPKAPTPKAATPKASAPKTATPKAPTPAPAAAPATSAPAGAGPRQWAGPPAGAPAAQAAEADLDALLPKLGAEEEGPEDLMARIAAAGASPEARRAPRRLSKAGLLAMRVWAVVGYPAALEDVVDHLMDCDKSVFTVSEAEGAHFASLAAIGADPSHPSADVLALVEGGVGRAEAEALVEEAARRGFRGVVLHPSAAPFGGAGMLQRCADLGLAAVAVDIFEEATPGTGIPVAPID